MKSADSKVIDLDSRRPRRWGELTLKEERENKRLRDRNINIFFLTSIICLLAFGVALIVMAANLRTLVRGPEELLNLDLTSGFGYLLLAFDVPLSFIALHFTRHSSGPLR